MRAAVLRQQGGDISIEDGIEIIAPRAGEVRVNISYCSLCHSDYSILSGAMLPLEGPIILGHEASGVVESIGEGVTNLSVGDHVVLTPLPSCGTCYYCLRGDYSLCVQGQSMMTNRLSDGTTGLSSGGEEILRGIGVAALKLVASSFSVLCECFKGYQALEFSVIFPFAVAHGCGGIQEEIDVALFLIGVLYWS